MPRVVIAQRRLRWWPCYLAAIYPASSSSLVDVASQQQQLLGQLSQRIRGWKGNEEGLAQLRDLASCVQNNNLDRLDTVLLNFAAKVKLVAKGKRLPTEVQLRQWSYLNKAIRELHGEAPVEPVTLYTGLRNFLKSLANEHKGNLLLLTKVMEEMGSPWVSVADEEELCKMTARCPESWFMRVERMEDPWAFEQEIREEFRAHPAWLLPVPSAAAQARAPGVWEKVKQEKKRCVAMMMAQERPEYVETLLAKDAPACVADVEATLDLSYPDFQSVLELASMNLPHFTEVVRHTLTAMQLHDSFSSEIHSNLLMLLGNGAVPPEVRGALVWSRLADLAAMEEAERLYYPWHLTADDHLAFATWITSNDAALPEDVHDKFGAWLSTQTEQAVVDKAWKLVGAQQKIQYAHLLLECPHANFVDLTKRDEGLKLMRFMTPIIAAAIERRFARADEPASH